MQSSEQLNLPQIDIQKIIRLSGVPEERIWNIYLYGSRVYGTASPSSDMDFLVVASSLHAHKEFFDGEYNVHIKTPDIFKDQLWKHNMTAMECVFAPSFAKIKESIDCKFVSNQIKVRRTALSESHHSWMRAKRMLMDGDVHRGMKSVWHSLRILIFADQILKNGGIVDFSAANHFWKQIESSEHTDWDGFKTMLLDEKRKLERIVR